MTGPFAEGYLHARDVFSPEEMVATELALANHPDNVLRYLMHHPRVLKIAKWLCGDVIEQTGEHVVNYEPTRLYTDWHYDVPWGSARTPMPLWRFGVYYRDYATHSGGLEVVPGSHLGRPAPPGYFTDMPVYVRSRPRDLVVWNLRMMHRAGAENDDLPVASPRNAVFFDYAAPCEDLERYKVWRAEVREARSEP